MKTLYGIPARTIDGEDIDLARYRGHVLLIVNVASKCGYTPQYKDLQTLYSQYRERGLRILAFPCNDFLGQEPGAEADIRQFCQTRYAVEFDLFAKIKILGPNAHPLYRFLQNCAVPTLGKQPPFFFKWITRLAFKVRGTPAPADRGVQWNFHKYLVNKLGEPVAEITTQTPPLDPLLTSHIEKLLLA